jgi:hypothetical protein
MNYLAIFLIVLAVELGLRFLPTRRALSIPIVVGSVLRLAGSYCLKLDDVVDHVLPQRVSKGDS